MLLWVVTRVVVELLAAAVRPASRRASTRPGGGISQLLARLTSIDPALVHESQQVSRAVVALAGLLEAELGRFRDMENRIYRAVGQLEATTRAPVDDELLTKLARRLGTLNVRPALQRLERAHPDAPTDDATEHQSLGTAQASRSG